MKKLPSTPFCIPLSRNTKEARIRFLNILKWKKARPPRVALLLILCMSVLCCSAIAYQPENTYALDSPGGNFGASLGPKTQDPSLPYSGGILTVPYHYRGCGVGIGSGHGFGALLMLDGIPQPYYTDAEPEWAYFHNIITDYDLSGTVNLHMIPVTGAAGEAHTLSLLKVNDPGYQITSDGIRPLKHLDGTIMIQRRIDFLTDPPACPIPPIHNRIRSIEMETEETSTMDIALWTEEQLRYDTGCDLDVSINGSIVYTGAAYGVSPEDSVIAHVRVWGNPQARQLLLLFVNHEPLIVDPQNLIRVQTEPGKTTMVNISLDFSDLEQEAVIYGIRLIENRSQCGLDQFPKGECISATDDILYPKYLLREQWREGRFEFHAP